MHEGRIADNCHALVLGLSSSRLVEAVKSRDGSSHTDSCIDSVERCGSSESVAADVSRYGNAQLLQAVEQSSVGTSCTHYGRTNGDIVLEGNEVFLLAQYLLCDDGLGKLADISEYLLALYVVHADVAAVLLDYAVKLLDNVDLLVLLCEVLNELLGERIYHAKLQHGSLLTQSFLDVLIAGAVGDNAELSLVGKLHSVER